MSDLLDLSQEFFRAIIEKRVADILAHYADAETTYVFVEGPRWSTIGFERIAEGWRAFVNAPLSLVACKWVEGPFSQASGDMAWLAGIAELTVRVGDQTKSIRLRGTYVLRQSAAGSWQVAHEHFSQPMADPYDIGDWLKSKDEG